ncbi:MAG: hypothetical protein AB8B72_05125 [Crocinitomicaceae bacterium]
MKKGVWVILLAVGIISCSGSKIIGYSYTEGGMMGSVKTTITADSLSFLRYSEGQKSYEAQTSNAESWALVHSMGKHIDYKGMDTLKAPSMGRATDAAPFANFEIITKDSVYTSASFDGGKPPVSLAAIVLQMSKISTSETSKK